MIAAGRYRRDIDGLRAIAILPVLLFHAHVPGFSGGYVGVDIFFVISGFLITGIIAREVDEQRFSLVHFYERRFRRIMPALSLMILAVLAAACLMLGGVASLWLPLNKHLWTPSFVLWSGGLSVTALLLAHLLIDRWGAPALGRRFGVNAIAAYLGSSAMALVLGASGAWAWAFTALAAAMPAAPARASLLCALGFVAVWWGVVWALDRRRLYLKI